MPDLDFAVECAAPERYCMAPTLAFRLRITNRPADEVIHSILLRCQIQIETTRRRYTPGEQRELFDLFGPPEDWGRTLRRLLFGQVSANVSGFSDAAEINLLVPCTADLSVAVSRYFEGLEGGDAPLSFLFSGTVFYAGARMPLQVAQISWEKEARFALSAATWNELMEHYHRNNVWLPLRKDVAQRLQQFQRHCDLPTWERAIETLLETSSVPETCLEETPDHG
jgi:hypothetical protein